MNKDSNIHYGQAADLRGTTAIHPIQVIAISAGKGGVGKSNITVNLAVGLAKQGKRVLVLDADLGLANIDVLVGIHPQKNLSHVLTGECELVDIILEGPAGIQIIPSSSGLAKMARLNKVEHAGVINAFSQITQAIDVLLIDTATGISDTVTSFTRSSQEVIIVVCDEPASITDAYALIKVLGKEYGVQRFHILGNMVRSLQEGKALYTKLNRITDRFLDVQLKFIGAIPYDDFLRKAVKQQKAVCEMYPSSKSGKELFKLAKKISTWPVCTDLNGQITFFIERLAQC